MISIRLVFLLTALTAQAGPIGFASIGQPTTGGGKTKPVIVTTAVELQRELERLDLDKKQRDTAPRVIRLAGDIDLAELANDKPGKILQRTGIIHPRSHTTLEGPPGGATLLHGCLELKGAENVIIRNLRFRDLWENDPTGQYDDLGWDYIRVTSAGKKPSNHVWIDHCDFGRVYDGQVDVVHGSDLVTISHCVFQGEGTERHKKGMLIGHSSSASARAIDTGRLNVTIHHCWFRNLESRCPRLRSGNVHFLNNLVDNVKNGTVSVTGGATLVENCVYRDCPLTTAFSYAGDSTEKGLGGSIRTTGSLDHGGKPFNDSPGEFRFNKPAAFDWPDPSKPPYDYQPAPAAEVEALVKAQSGPR